MAAEETAGGEVTGPETEWIGWLFFEWLQLKGGGAHAADGIGGSG
jgi:hypothetical protein